MARPDDRWDDDEDEGGFARRHRGALIAGAVGAVAVAVIAFFILRSSSGAPPKPPPTMTMVMVQPPKPPPPPPPPPPQQKTITPPKMTVPTAKPLTPNQPPKPAPPKPASPANVPLGTSLKANGTSNNFDLSGNAGGNGFLGGGGGGGGGSWEGYVSNQIEAALQKDPRTRYASAGLEVKLWFDGSGAVTQAVLVQSSGNAGVDRAITAQILPGLRLGAPPPAGTPMPVLMRLTGQAPL